MASSSPSVEGPCRRSRRCSKADGHKGRCNSEQELSPFWESSPVFIEKKRKRENESIAVEVISASSRLAAIESEITNTKATYEEALTQKGKLFFQNP